MAERSGDPRLGTVAGVACLAALVVALGWVVARPLDTNDFWWHLELGKIFATQGLSLERDPLTHTAPPGPPPRHSWLFDVSVYGLHGAVGFQGLRVVHLLAALSIVWLAFSLLRRESGSLLAASAGTAVFVALSSWRLTQLRPDLMSIAATLGLYRLLLEPEEPPSRTRALAAVALVVVWANAHALFATGPLLVGAGLLGIALRAALLRRVSSAAEEPARERRRLARVGGALALGLLASLANPDGFGQLGAFLRSSAEGAIFSVGDEWAPFDPFSPPARDLGLDLPTWIATDALLLLFGMTTVVGAVRLVRRPSRETLRAADPALLAVGVAGCVALLAAVRFLWMGLFPLLALLRARRAVQGETGARALTAWLPLAATAALAVALPTAGTLGIQLRTLPGTLSAYLSTAYDTSGYHARAVRFLRQTGVTGNLFNSYAMGGFLDYWVGPGLRTFVDGRMNVPAEVLREYHQIVRQRGTPPETFLDLLDRRGVDLFFGVGVPTGESPREATLYTTAHLERAPGWILVFRSVRNAIYLRRNERNLPNLRRIAAHYRRQNVPFDPERGLDVAAVLRDRPRWAEANGMLPVPYAPVAAARASADPAARRAALEALGTTHALVGAYEEGIAIDDEAIAMDPGAVAPRQRRVYALLRLDRPRAAVAAALELRDVDPGDGRSETFLRVARDVLTASEAGAPSGRIPLDAAINALPLIGD